ncbi:AAA family ATPase [Photobacterium phosphoreum]|uniref:AAA family ATPase n=1 Tax=Photobacterium phosphoreum TaxID=659 RepID=UPI001E62E15E|nr:AAA family ATPase [Photobacterium phosphoreum]MCD9474226.1 AAA family ATPase [Photobacterium phosphoreum]MCF2175027.1 AAA family ATPase [Photobacterium phosphoreum]
MGNVYIEKVQVEGGFLDGMSLELENGLNTVIGARGTGKSTFIELIRYCLNIKGHTSESHAKSLSHAKSVLKDGQVLVTLSDGVHSYSYSRTADGETIPPIHNDINLPLIFSQTEVENIGLVSSGRLKLIDDFIGGTEDLDLMELSSISQIESYSSEIMKLSMTINETEDKLIVLPKLKKNLDELIEEEKKLTAVSEQANIKSQELKKLSDHYLKVSSDIEQLKDYIEVHERVRNNVADITSPYVKELSLSMAQDEVQNMLDNQGEAYKFLGLAISKFDDLVDIAKRELEKLYQIKSKITKNGQGLRSEVDLLQKGAGELSRKTQQYKEEIGKLENIARSNLEKKNRIEKLKQDRNAALDKLDGTRIEKTSLREKVCNMLSKNLAPRIRVHIEERSQIDEYQQVVINALKGSGIKYNELAPLIAESIPPQMLLRITEEDDIDSFLSMLNITKDRASRVINALKSSIHAIATVKLEDEIILELLDGSETKNLSELSTGQRCTVILPIILEHRQSALIVDQPEDHIDNAFIVETLIASIKRRTGEGQTIVTTHNANVPVLGEAEEVIHLNSDGTRGYVQAYGSLMDPRIVNAISSVMEGGREAFKCRANFYE